MRVNVKRRKNFLFKKDHPQKGYANAQNTHSLFFSPQNQPEKNESVFSTSPYLLHRKLIYHDKKNHTFTVNYLILKKVTYIFLLAFYSFGTLCLPLGDFSSLNDLPAMYQHCKATEHKDMTPIDFITDHLLNIDCLFDEHENGDEQKPHTPIQFHHQQSQSFFLTHEFKVTESHIAIIQVSLPVYEEANYYSNFLSSVFRPPIG